MQSSSKNHYAHLPQTQTELPLNNQQQHPPTPPMSQNSSPMPHPMTNVMIMNGNRHPYAPHPAMSMQPQSMPPPSYDMPYMQSVHQPGGPYRMPVCIPAGLISIQTICP